jgi:hypothetical protein
MTMAINVYSVNSQESDAQKDAAIFMSCNGKPTGAGAYTQDNFSRGATCVAGVMKPKYVQFLFCLQINL